MFTEAIIVTAQFDISHPALWLDPKAAVGSAEREQLEAAGLQLLPVATLDDLKQGLAKARLVVIRLMADVGLLEEVKKLTQSFGHDVPVMCRVERNSLSLGIEAMRRGACHVIPADEWSADSWRDALALVPKRPETPKAGPQKFVFVDPNSQHLLELARRVAQTQVSALIVGPTGAGKEVLARVLHDASPRRNGPFVALNCAALPENLIEDLLFGHEKGAFTGALKEHRGLFEQANGGTIFLDEIAEMPYHLQTKLLRVLQDRKVTRLGGQAQIDLDIRLVAATNKDLREAIVNREFREDLYFRISAFKLSVLPLRERQGDILPLVLQFLNKFGPADRQVQLSPRAAEMLSSESRLVWTLWQGERDARDPGLARHNAMQRAAAAAEFPLLWCAPWEPDALEMAFLETWARRHPVMRVRVDWSAEALPALHAQSWPEMLDEGLAEAAEPVLPDGLRLYPARSMEDEAQAAAQTIVDWIAAGKKRIALVPQDRVVARRLRALLERADIVVSDETGWKLSTTRAAAVIHTWMELVSAGGEIAPLLDFLKSPFVRHPALDEPASRHALERALVKLGHSGSWSSVVEAVAALPDVKALVDAIARVSDLMNSISRASTEQSAGVAQVGEAVTQMDMTTQQNAALVEQAAAAAASLEEQATRLAQSVSVFRLK